MQAVSRVLLLPYTVWLTQLLLALGALFGMAGAWLHIDRSAFDQVFVLYIQRRYARASSGF